MKVFSEDSRGGVRLSNGVTYTEGELVPYRNKITGEDDPMIRFAPSRFLHRSTLRRQGIKFKTEHGEDL